MERPLVPLEALGKRVSAALDAYSVERARAVEVARRRLLDRVLRRPERGTWRFAYGAALATALAAAAVAVVVTVRSPRPLAFTADGAAGALQSWVAAPRERAVPMRFSDGTELRVEPSSRVRVLEIDQRGASIALENGGVHADVVHTSDSAWRMIAGPLTVRVTGTRFDVRWSAVTEEFSVSVQEGSVAVAGSIVGAERPVRAGETLRVSVLERRLELTKGPRPEAAAVPAPAASVAPSEAPPAKPDRGTPAAPPAPPSSPGSAAPRPVDWRELARGGSLRKAFAAAEASGFAAACDAATPAELLTLGDAARLSGRPDRASQAFLALRGRYPGDSRRAAAAFMLGKVAFDQTRTYGQAAEWFRTSIREQPSGSLTREASGRLMEALQRAGDAAGARRAAEDYLARYRGGPHADLARSLVR